MCQGRGKPLRECAAYQYRRHLPAGNHKMKEKGIKKMYIKLIQPKMVKRPMDTALKIRMSPPLGLYTILNMLHKDHHIVIENENIQKINYIDKPDIVGITVTVDTYPRAVKIAREFKKRGIIVVAGGIHITTAYKTLPAGDFDVLCIGAAEGTWNDIVSDFQAGCLKPVYNSFRSDKEYAVISPAYEAVKSKEYLYSNIIHTSRGCPFRCDFCYNSSENRTYLNRRPEDIIHEIKTIGSRHIMFIDDNFIGNIQWTKDFLDKIKPLKLKWNAAVSINIVNHLDLLDKMKESGCQSLFIGFESINSNSVKRVHKIQNEPDNYEIAVKEIHKRGIMINASFVFGLDGDTRETFKKTLDWIVENKIETVTSHILTPYPGTALYEKMRRENRITTNDLSLYNTAHVVFKPANMSQQELYSGYIWLYKEVYSLKNIIKRIPKSKNQVMPYLMFNLFYRKFGRFTDILCRLISYRLIGRIAQRLSKYV